MSRPIPVDDSELVQIISGNAVIPTDAKPSTTTIRIYLHSDCIDTYYERSRLWRDVFPDVCAHARSLGLHLSIVDPYHMMDCLPEQRNQILPFALEAEGVYQLNMKEITICQEFSGGISFMTLLGQKYGYRALRSAIEEDEFGVICNNIEDRQSKQLLKAHYRLDKRLMPSQYVLRRPSKMNEEWAKVQSKLARNIRKGARVAYGKDPTKVQRFTVSVTEEEITQGVLTLQGVDQPHSVWFKRTFTDLTDQRPSIDSALGYYSDVTEGKRGLEFDSENVKLLNYLKEARMPTGLNPANIFDFPIKWHKGKGLALDFNEDHDSYLKQLCKTVTQYFKGMLATVSENLKSKRIHSIYQECILHGQQCRQLLRNFKERKNASEQILSYLNTVTMTDTSFPLVVYGESGSGKSSVIASVVRDIQQSIGGDKCCIVRFVGLTPSSRDIRRLLISICQQISLVYGCNNLIPASHESVQKTFNELLSSVPTRDKPLFILLDGIDSLDSDNEALGLSWLPAKLPPNVGLVVTVSSEIEYRCYHLLRSIIKDKSSFVQVPTFSLDESEMLLQYFLELKHLRITPFHTFLLSDALQMCQSLTPLYLKMVAVATKSVKQINSDITDLKSVVNMLFQHFEGTHGQVYVTQALRIITASKYGMSEDELMDILSCNSQVLSDVKLKCHGLPFNDCSLAQLPVIVWSRLLNDLWPHLLCFRMSVDGAWLLQWKNRRLKEIVMERYFKSKQSLVETNQLIADYFSGKMAADKVAEITNGNLSNKDIVSDNQQSTLQSHSHTSNQHESEPVTTQECDNVIVPVRDINPQLLKLSEGFYNLRRLTELPPALLNAKQHCQLIEMLMDHQFLNACAQMDVTDHVISVISTLIEPIDINGQYGSVARELRLLKEALSLSINNLTKNPSQLSIELLGRLLPYGMNAIDQPHINTLLTNTIINNRPRLTPLHLYSAHPNEHILLSMAGHLDAIICIDSTIIPVQNDGEEYAEERVIIMSSSADGTLRSWDWRGSGVLKTFDGHSGAVLCVAVSKNGHYTSSGGDDHTVRFWRVHDAECLHVLKGHTGPVTGTAVTKLCNKVISGSLDGTVKVWNSEQSSRCKGELVYTLRPSQALVGARRLGIHSICLCKDDSELLTGLANGCIVVINVIAGEILRYFDTSLTVRKPVLSIAMAQVGDKRMVVSVSDSSAHLNDYCTGKQVDSVPCEVKLYGKLAGRDIQSVVARLPDSIISNDASITALSFSDLGKFGITGSEDGCIKIWDLKKSEHLQSLSNGGAILDVTCSPNGDCIATLCEQKDDTVIVNLSKADDLTQPFATLKRIDSRVISVKFYNDSDSLFTAHEDGIVRLWDTKTREVTDEFPCKGSGTGSNIDPMGSSAVTCITISDNHKVLIAGTGDGRLVMWNLTNKTKLQSKTTPNDHDRSIIKIIITPGSVKYLVSSDASGTTVVRDYTTLEVISFDKREKGVELCCLGAGLDYNRNMMLARAYIDGKIQVSSVPALEHIWVLDSGGHVTCGNGHVTSVNYLCGVLIATHRHDDRSGCVQIWDKGTCLYSCVTDSGITSAIVTRINGHGVILYGDQEGYVGTHLYNATSHPDNDVTLSLLRQASLATITTVTTNNQRKLSDVSRARISQTTLQSLKEVEETTIEDTPLQGREAGPEWEGPKEDATPSTKEEEVVQSECPLNEDKITNDDKGNDTIQQPSSSTCIIL